MNKITKVIIPAAGLGTRFLPATKSLPKEMFPIIDTPNLQYIVQEAVNSGITDIGIIISFEKPSIQKHFEIDPVLEHKLLVANKLEEYKIVREIGSMVNIHFILQEEPKGLGHAILCAKDFIGDDDFAIMLGDDLIVNKGTPALKQLIDVYEATGNSVLGVQEVPFSDVSKYGIIKPIEKSNGFIKISSIVEKPQQEKAPSNLAVLGRYVLSNKIFDELLKIKEVDGKEIQLTEGIDHLIKQGHVYACIFEGVRYDIGDKFGYIKATIDFALEREDLKEKVIDYLKKVVK